VELLFWNGNLSRGVTQKILNECVRTVSFSVKCRINFFRSKTQVDLKNKMKCMKSP